ncbi:MAG: glycosyltransferase [Rudaea sp.]|uniref:glycosyltransferase n=1 Tax=Rudaea sp. TaxID=2136325 RepID=UPI0039E42AE7
MQSRDDIPIKLLIMTDTAILGPGGSERFLRNLLLRLPQERYRIDVLQLAAEPAAAERVAELNLPAIHVLHRPIGASYGLRGLATLNFVRARVRREGYAIVQSQHEKSDLINALLPRRHGMRKISNRRDMGFQKSARVRSLFRLLNRRFDRVIAPTARIVEALIANENVERKQCRVFANGVDTQRFRPNPGQRLRIRTELGLDRESKLIGCVASFTPVKRHVDLLDAFAQVRLRHPRARLLLIGEGPLRAQIEERIAALDLTADVHLLGARADVENLLPALDAFVLASSTEGMSNAILEAQACGVPVVATAVGGNPDLVHDRHNGLLVPALAPDALATALAELLDHADLREAMGSAARAQIEESHSLEAMASAYDCFYRELVYAR